MNHDFIRIKSLSGDLKMSHKKRDFGLTVSTEEMVLQKPHVNYHIRLLDIVSIVPFQNAHSHPFTVSRERRAGSELTSFAFNLPHYKFMVRHAVVHNRSGIFELGSSEFIMPVLDDMLQIISEYAGLRVV